MRTVASLTLILLAVGLDSGCASSDSSPETGRRPRAVSTAGEMQAATAKLTKGMSQADVHAVLGAPERTAQSETEIGPVEAWIYRWQYVARSEHIQTGTQSYSRENPITGQLETVNEPIMGIQQIYAIDELTLVFSEGRLIEWAGTRNESRQVN